LTARYWGGAVALLAFGVALTTGLIGIDYGRHWDEPMQLQLVNQSIHTGLLLPTDFYNYPSVVYDLCVLASATKIKGHLGTDWSLTGAGFYLGTRSLFLVVSTLGGLFLYGAGRRLAGELAGAVAASVYLLSWQFAYHARWIAPDAVMTSFAALFLLALALAWRPGAGRWALLAPAIAAGLAAATKYQGAILLLPALAAPVVWGRREGAGPRAIGRSVLASLGAFALTFVVLTPGAVLQPGAFRLDIAHENLHYHSTHGAFLGTTPHDVHGFATYLWLLTKYVVLSLPSRYPVVSLAVVALALGGAWSLLRRDRWLAAAVAVPCLALAVYYSTLTVFVVRNFLIFLPFLALLGGLGAQRALGALRRLPVRAASLAVLALCGVLSAGWLVVASASVARRSPAATARAMGGWLDDHRGDVVVLSPPVRALLARAGVRPRAGGAVGAPDYYALLHSQLLDTPGLQLARWPATTRGTYRSVGSHEVDLDFYPTWIGDDRVLLMTPREAASFGLDHAELARLGVG
jgi:4-amino-4-deoxy-L-arabinose transferase-like glycosyltransferase